MPANPIHPAMLREFITASRWWMRVVASVTRRFAVRQPHPCVGGARAWRLPADALSATNPCRAEPAPLACLGASEAPLLRQAAGRPGVYACSVPGTLALDSSVVNGADDLVDGGRAAGTGPRGRRL